MIARCAYCQEVLKTDARFCRHCGHAQPSTVLTAPAAQPADQAAPTKHCPNCGEELPAWAAFCGNCRSTQPLTGLTQQPRVTLPLAPRATAPLEQTRPCPTCGAESPLWARFCGTCSQPLTGSGSISDAATVVSVLPFAGGSGGAFAPPATPGAISGVPGAFAGPQSGAPGVPGAFAGPQSGVPNVPGASGPYQGSGPTMPNAPTAPHTGTQPWQGSSTAAKVAGRGALRGLRYKLLGTVQAKIITALVAATVVVTAGGATAAYIITRPHPVIQVTSDFHPAGHTPPVGAPAVTLHVTGQDFSDNSSVTFALDGAQAPGAQGVTSDSKGNITANVVVTTAWRYGFHTLTATDASHYTTKSGVQVEIIPRPVITVMSQYQQAGTPAGSTSTTFTISGKWFSYSRPVTFLLDGQVAPGSHSAESDKDGNVMMNLTVTGDWRLGTRMLTAKDDQGYSTASGMSVAIVPQGEAGTPGPHGAPADDASFSIAVTIEAQDPYSGQTTTIQETLTITGQADPNGGLVCRSVDNNQPYTVNGEVVDSTTGQPTGVTYQEMLTSTCQGTYKSGKLSYTETITSDQYSLSNGVSCQAQTPYTLQSLSGSFSSSTDSSGDWQFNAFNINCDQGYNLNSAPSQQASWSGTTSP